MCSYICILYVCAVCISYSHTSAVYKDYLILVGGVSFSCLSPPVEMVHLMTGHSQKLELPVSLVCMLLVVKYSDISVSNMPRRYGNSCIILDHTVLSVTW